METKTLKTTKVYALDKPLQMVKMANLLKKHIVDNNLYVPIMGRNYVMVEGWQFAGGMMGLFPRVIKVENIAPGKWMAQVEIINAKTDKVMGSGFAICSKEEMKKKSFDEYAILSMAQTRAVGKAYRNLIGWVMKLAGYESTPAEEMKGVKTEKEKPKAEMSDVTFQKAKDAIAKTKDIFELPAIKEKIEKSKIYTLVQKKTLLKLINDKLGN